MRLAMAAALGLVTWLAFVDVARVPAVAGPLAAAGTIDTGFGVDPGDAVSWGTALPANRTVAPVTIVDVSLVVTRGVEILGVTVNALHDGPVGLLPGYPPRDVPLLPPAGSVQPPDTAPGRGLQVLVGVRLQPSAVEGAVEGLRVHYRHAEADHVLVLADALHLTRTVPTAGPPLPLDRSTTATRAARADERWETRRRGERTDHPGAGLLAGRMGLGRGGRDLAGGRVRRHRAHAARAGVA